MDRGIKHDRRLWVFDFDGTLSNLVPERTAAQILPEAGELLKALLRLPGHRAAVLSSRLLEDLIPRVGIPGLYLGGGSGAEWLLPDGRRIVAEGKTGRLENARKVVAEIDRLKAVQGVDIEDKKWSVAVHVRNVSPDARAGVIDFLGALQEKKDIRLLRGPEVFEVQLLPEIDKRFGVETLSRIASFGSRGGLIVYAGDDENDAVAMAWVVRQGGMAISVGNHSLVPGARSVKTPAELVKEVRKLAGLDSFDGG